MFEFFEGLIEKLGIKLITDFSSKLLDFIKDVRSNSTSSNNDNGNNSAQIGSSGDSAKIGSSGDYAQIGSSGYYAQIGSSGDYAQIGSSGDSAQIDISGTHSVGFAAGMNSIIKAKKGTWISLCEYKKDENGDWLPEFALSAQIGNKEYKDFKGRILKETEYYCLVNKKFYPVDVSDEIKTIKISEKKRDEITIIKGLSFQDYKTEVYIVKSGEFSAHGENLKQAMDDLLYKKTKSEETEKIVEEIKKTGKVNRAQYRAITGACQFGTEQFIQQHNIQDLEKIELSELRKILTLDNFGAEKFWRLIDEK